MIPESIAISDDYLLHEQAVTVSAAPPCMPTSADDILHLLIGNDYHDRAGDIITKKRNRMGPAAGPSLILRSWLSLREVEDWEPKLDVEEELQVEEVDILFREHSSRT